MRSRWGWGSGSGALKAWVLGAGAGLFLTACGGLGAGTLGSTPGTAARRGRAPSAAVTPAPPRSPVTSPGLSSPAAGAVVSVGPEQNDGTVVLKVGQKLLVTLPRSNERELGDELVRSSDQSVLQLENQGGSGGSLPSVLQAPFLALRPGRSTVSVSGQADYRLLVEVEPG